MYICTHTHAHTHTHTHTHTRVRQWGGWKQVSYGRVCFHQVIQSTRGTSQEGSLSDLGVLTSLVDVPEDNRFNLSCPHSIVMLILIQYVDNSGITYKDA